ncbi:MAG: hypothetical protein KAU14_07895 [Thermoplasmata archaeon]|nr:hypothetical protein [Thermoplasmata archaeon]
MKNLKGTKKLVEELWPGREKIREMYTGILLNLLKGEVSKEEAAERLKERGGGTGEILEKRFEAHARRILSALTGR